MSNLFRIRLSKQKTIPLILMIGFIVLVIYQPQYAILAQSPDGKWSDFVDISNTPTASTFPCIVADAAGNVHALWSEDVGGKTKNLLFNSDGTPALDRRGEQINQLTDAGNSLFYSRWDGKAWKKPINVQFNPAGLIEYPEVTVDDRGTLHAIWVNGEGAITKLFYSRAPAEKADDAREWSPPVELANPILFAYYPLDISTDISGGLHILFSKIGPDPGAYVINSFDNGDTWSAPIQLYSTFDEKGEQEGVSPVRLVSDPEGRLHATWTRYDEGGNGKAIFYSQSRDQGRTWTEPFLVATWQPGWYEVDWLSVGVVGDEIHLVWEGSSQVATQVERISYDGGQTWGEPNYILPNIVGENGFADLVTDSANQLHLLVVKRGDAATLSHGIWYTTWEKDHWQDPILLGTTDGSLYSKASELSVQDPRALMELLQGTLTGSVRYQRSAILNGNKLFTIVVNEWDGEIWSSHTTLPAPLIYPKPYLLPSATRTQPPVPASQAIKTLTPTLQSFTSEPLGRKNNNPLNFIMLGVLPALLLVLGFVAYSRILKRP